MSIANTDQAERWNSGDDVGHWISNQERYDRMNEPFAALILAAAGLRLGSVRREMNVQDEITVFYRQRKMQFRVVWIKKLNGTSEFQVGLQAVTQDREAWVLSFAEFRGEPVPQAASQASGVA